MKSSTTAWLISLAFLIQLHSSEDTNVPLRNVAKQQGGKLQTASAAYA
jgi:hypothetical protein